jgi:hypothetical protein
LNVDFFSSFRGARSANLRCAIAHRGISIFPDVRLHIRGLVPTHHPRPIMAVRPLSERNRAEIEYLFEIKLLGLLRQAKAFLGPVVSEGDRARQKGRARMHWGGRQMFVQTPPEPATPDRVASSHAISHANRLGKRVTAGAPGTNQWNTRRSYLYDLLCFLHPIGARDCISQGGVFI